MKVGKTVMAVLAVSVLLLLGAAALLLQGVGQFRDISGQLNESRRRLDEFYRRNPFPAEENIDVEREYLRNMQAELVSLRRDMAEDQVEPVHTAPVRFVESFRETASRLTQRADDLRVDIPDNFAFGFRHHRAGELPSSADVPRLMQQLNIAEQLVNVLYDAGVAEIISIQRQEFDVREEPEARPERGSGLYGGREPARRERTPSEPPERLGVLQENSEYASLRFTLEFRLRERALLDVLNALTSHRMFVVVKRVEVNNRFDWQPMRTASKTAADDKDDASLTAAVAVDSMESLTRSERVVTGRTQTPVHVAIEVEVYRFREDETS